ncbi:MAG: HAD-IC family P-type ATPase, partial [Clostridia bacterium]
SYELLELAALAESMSTHPISMSICAAYKKTPDANSVRDITELSGLGVRALVHGKTVLVGSGKLLTREGIAFSRPDIPGTIVLVASDGKYVGAIAISDELKSDSREVVARLRAVGVRKCVMLTGDAAASAMRVADAVHVDEVYAELLPGDKVAHIESLLCAGTLAFVGDGINDAPSLARADIGVAMGGIGSDAAIEAADVVLMTDETSRLADAIMISRGTRAIVRQNIVFSLAVKIIFLILGALGVANMWEAVFADVGVSIIAILNATRAMRLLNKR